MTISEARLVYFSSTHTSKQVAEVIAHGTGIKNIISMNLTLQTVEETVIPTSALAIVVVPVYGGHVAPLDMERPESIRGLGTPAVLVVVYGNRAYEKALMELDTSVISHGLKVIAGATFIDEHSYSIDKCPIADGRPNESDLGHAEDFGRKVVEKIQTTDEPGTPCQVDVCTIKHPSQSFFPLFRFLRKVIKLRKSDIPLPRTPRIENESLCTHCGTYAARCPAEAITKGDKLNTNAEKCIKCCVCMKVCINRAGKHDIPFASLLSEYFRKQELLQTIL